MHWYPHHIGDHARAVAHLTDDEDLAYRRLKDWQVENERPIPLDIKWIARRIRRTEECVQTVLDDFFTMREDGWIEKNIWGIIEEYQEVGRKKSEGGKRGAAAKAAKKAGIVAKKEGGNEPEEQKKPTDAGRICKMLREQCKMQATSPSDPRLQQAIHAGATDDDFLAAGYDAVSQGKPWGWFLGAVNGRLRDAKMVAKGGGAAHAKNAPKARKTGLDEKLEEDRMERKAAGVPVSPF